MSYDVQLFRIETKQNHYKNPTAEFFENEENLEPFTPEQKQELHDRLLQYEYVVNGEGSYEHSEIKGIEVLLTNRAVYFTSGRDGIDEILMTTSEFTDDGQFAKFDPQDEGWEEEPT